MILYEMNNGYLYTHISDATDGEFILLDGVINEDRVIKNTSAWMGEMLIENRAFLLYT